MDITISAPNPTEAPSPFAWPTGAHGCMARMTVQQGRVIDLGNNGCDLALAPEFEVLRALSFPSDELTRVIVVSLQPPVGGELAEVRLEAPSVAPWTWGVTLAPLPVEFGVRCHADLTFRMDTAQAVVEPACPKRLGSEIRRASAGGDWRVSGQKPSPDVVFHAGVDFQWIQDMARPKRGVLAVELTNPRMRDGDPSALTDALTFARITDVSFTTQLFIDPKGGVERVVVDGCETKCQEVVSRAAQEWVFWPAFASGVAVPSELTMKTTVTSSKP